ncbi:MAG: imidazole glycerol phosphate synthase subunit HisH [Clostridiales bacterium]|jgi:glutamine amidotransferase|nr:imidazole glycerol phosphate synthase subunit HisH [Clostridiales bacterium]
MIAIIDYGAGNLFSVKNALDYLGYDNKITNSMQDIMAAEKMILPGVGSFPAAMKMLRESGLEELIKEEAKKKPLLGICLGMQMLFDVSYEFEEIEGLSLIPGEIRLIDSTKLKIPHMGWNSLLKEKECALSKDINEGDMVYYVHSYQAYTSKEYISMYSEYGGIIPGLVFQNNIYGTQFHPEKSGEVGLKILRNFGELE